MTFIGSYIRVDELQDSMLERAFPGIDRWAHYSRMDSWLHANPRKRPRKNMQRFIHAWLEKHVAPAQPEAQVGSGPSSKAKMLTCGCGEPFHTKALLEKHQERCKQ